MSKLRLAITTGDVDGIGLEVACKALLRIKSSQSVQFVLFRSSKLHGKKAPLLLEKLRRHLKSVVVSSLSDAIHSDLNSFQLIEVSSENSPGAWFVEAALASKESLLDGIITGPLSKAGLKRDGFSAVGHTDLLKKILRKQDLRMAFCGSQFNVVLITDHVPLRRAVSAASTKNILKTLLLAQEAFGSSLQKPLALLGLNPHAGEEGILGGEESLAFKKALVLARKKGIRVEGPLVPDTAFLKKNWSRYSAYICPYHDQGLIPFKMIHGQESGVHTTLGLPFVRTSVDHGTAKDIFDQNKAKSQSMYEAILMAIKLARQSGN